LFPAQETESGSLRTQLQSHADSIKILVAEKAEVEATVRKLIAELTSKNGELALTMRYSLKLFFLTLVEVGDKECSIFVHFENKKSD
jgi:hypothetical protein